jgi:hypothetical protein
VNEYVYCWSLRPETGFALELRVTASSAIVARREVDRFLIDHDGDRWTVEAVRRDTERAPFTLVTLPTSPTL